MATLKISNTWRTEPLKGQDAGGTSYPRGGGYESRIAMQKELVRRFKHRNARLDGDAVLIDNPHTIQRITWEN